jgi:predicted nucleotidyltransferase
MDASLSVPTVDIRERIPNGVIWRCASLIAERFLPRKIILFGSYAYGNPRPESDIDLLVVMDTPIRERVQAMQIRFFLDPLFGLDLIVYTPANLTRRIAEGDTFLKEILTRGKILYEAADD